MMSVISIEIEMAVVSIKRPTDYDTLSYSSERAKFRNENE